MTRIICSKIFLVLFLIIIMLISGCTQETPPASTTNTTVAQSSSGCLLTAELVQQKCQLTLPSGVELKQKPFFDDCEVYAKTVLDDKKALAYFLQTSDEALDVAEAELINNHIKYEKLEGIGDRAMLNRLQYAGDASSTHLDIYQGDYELYFEKEFSNGKQVFTLGSNKQEIPFMDPSTQQESSITLGCSEDGLKEIAKALAPLATNEWKYYDRAQQEQIPP